MWSIADKELSSRLWVGTALYPSPIAMLDAIQASGSEVVTVSLRRQSPQDRSGKEFWSLIQDLKLQALPNTAGCKTPKEAVALAQMAREIFHTHWIKLEVIGDDYTLQPDPIGLLKAAEQLVKLGFHVLPYTTDDLILAQRLLDAGCAAVMPWAAPIGSGLGLINPLALKIMRKRLPKATIIVDAGLGRPSDAAQALEMGCDAVLVNSAIALATDPTRMAEAFRLSVQAGRKGYEGGIMAQREMASPSTPTLGTPFWHESQA